MWLHKLFHSKLMRQKERKARVVIEGPLLMMLEILLS